jgi:hypothetical protein
VGEGGREGGGEGLEGMAGGTGKAGGLGVPGASRKLPRLDKDFRTALTAHAAAAGKREMIEVQACAPELVAQPRELAGGRRRRGGGRVQARGGAKREQRLGSGDGSSEAWVGGEVLNGEAARAGTCGALGGGERRGLDEGRGEGDARAGRRGESGEGTLRRCEEERRRVLAWSVGVVEDPCCADGGVGAHRHFGAVWHEKSKTAGLRRVTGRQYEN